MRLVGCRFVVAAVLLTVPRIGHGKCGDGPGDAQAIRRARAAADAACNAQRLGCATAPNQMKYLKCVSGQVNLAVKGGCTPGAPGSGGGGTNSQGAVANPGGAGTAAANLQIN